MLDGSGIVGPKPSNGESWAPPTVMLSKVWLPRAICPSYSIVFTQPGCCAGVGELVPNNVPVGSKFLKSKLNEVAKLLSVRFAVLLVTLPSPPVVPRDAIVVLAPLLVAVA